MLEDVEPEHEVVVGRQIQGEHVADVDARADLGRGVVVRHAADLDAFRVDTELGEHLQHGSGGTPELERPLRLQVGEELAHDPLVGVGFEVPHAAVLVVAVVDDRGLEPVEVGRRPRTSNARNGLVPDRSTARWYLSARRRRGERRRDDALAVNSDESPGS